MNGNCEFAHPSPARVFCCNSRTELSESFIEGIRGMSITSRSSGKDVLSRSGASFQATFGVKDDFMKNFELALSNPRQKMFVLLVDLDNVPKFYQKQSVQALSGGPFPLFVIGSANTKKQTVASQGNFHFTLALKSKDAADGILNMMAGALQMLIAGFGRTGCGSDPNLRR